MNNSVFEAVETSSRILRLDFSSIEFAKLAEEQDFSEAQIQAVGMVFEHLQRKKVDTTIHTLLKMSRLPLKDPKTFDNFDFSVIKGRDANRLKTLPSLSAIYAHRNLAFIGCKTSHSLRSSVYNLIKIKAETPSDNLPRYSADYLRVLFLL